jgi:hypothetical protein
MDSKSATNSSLSKLISIFAEKDCVKVLIKKLSDNDNSKNQVYLGMGFEAINFFPNLQITPDKNGLFKATLDFAWVDFAGHEYSAPEAKLILYPQYPEVRFSGFLKGCRNAPSELMTSRIAGRLLFLGIRADGQVFGHVVGRASSLAAEFSAHGELHQAGVFSEILLANKKQITNPKEILISELKRINAKGWIDSKRLKNGHIVQYSASNGGGYTLEAELGIAPNGISDPDFLGWEVKQYNVPNFKQYESGILTLMTPEPTGGYYRDKGVEAFIMKYGYADKAGRLDRFNFGGVHICNKQHSLTGLTLKLIGYDSLKGKITDENGAISLVRNEHEVAASWYFADLLGHWNRKHNQAVYIPSIKRTEPALQYHYGDVVRLCEGTDFLKLLKAFADGKVYYDPGIKLENASDPKLKKTKRRSQFRIKSREIPSLYKLIGQFDVTAV